MDARERMREVLRTAVAPDNATIDALLDSMLSALVEQAGDGWLIMAGAIREVQIADRFGPSSWEITTDAHLSDLDTWGVWEHCDPE